jgi:hypothetical protein
MEKKDAVGAEILLTGEGLFRYTNRPSVGETNFTLRFNTNAGGLRSA